MNQRVNIEYPSNEELRIIIITLGSMITKIGDAISSIASTFNLDETTNVENQQHLDEQERNLQILIDEMNDYIREVLAQIS